MKIGDESADDAKLEAGIDEQLGRRLSRNNGSNITAGRFQRPCRRRADSNHATAFTERAVDCRCRRFVDLVALGFDAVFFDALDAHGLERAVADVQCNLDHFDAAGADVFKQLWSEMQPGGWR